MSTRFSPIRRGALPALALLASLLSCGRDLTGPGGRGSLVALQLAPDFSSMVDTVNGVAYSVAELVPFTRVRVELRRVDNSVAASSVVDFPSDATELPLSIDVRLGAAARDGAEPLTAFLRYINAAGDTVFAGGPVAVTARAGRNEEPPPPVQIPIAPTVPGAVFASIDISPDSAAGNAGTSLNFTATGFDAQNNVVSNAIIGFVSRNPAIATVPNLGAGTVNLVAVRGETWIVAQSLTGLRDSAHVRVLPVPTQLIKISGDAQTALQNVAFAQPLRVRVLAADNLPVAGATVSFAVASGDGSVSAATATTDIDGYASVIWTAGATLGAASVTASVGTPAITATFTGTQVNAGPTSLAFETEPTAIVAGDTLPPIRVAVRNALGQTITSFTGVVSISRVGTAPGLLVGDTAVAAVAGVATFRGLTVTKAGTDYRLVAILAGVPNQLSSTFPVSPALPHAIQLVSGGGQFADPSTALAAPIVVRVIDVFSYPVVGATVNFAVQSGAGSVAPSSATTDANGQASVQWTVGAAGTQLLRITAGTAPALDVTAQLNDLDGPPVVFAGYDSTLVRIGFSRSVPIYLSSTADTAVTASLSTNNAGLTWSAPTATFAPQLRRSDVTLSAADALAPGTYWAYVNSAIGNDSIEVTVDSAFVMFTDLYYDRVTSGDTVSLALRLSDPAPAGGYPVRVKSLDTTFAQVLKATGGGPVTAGCLNPAYCNYSAVIVSEGTPDDSVDIVIPTGELIAHVAVIITTPPGAGSLSVPLSVSAAKHRGDATAFYTASSLPSISGEIDTVGVGLAAAASFFWGDISSARDRTFRLRSLTPALFTVDSIVTIPRLEYYSSTFEVRGLAAGTGLLEWGNAQVGFDTISIGVVPPRISLLNTGTTGPDVASRDFYVYLDAPGNTAYLTPLADVPITVTSLDTTVAKVETRSVTVPGGVYETTFTLRFGSVGSTKVVASSPGFIPDTLDVTSTAVSFTVNTGSGTLAVGTQLPWTVSIFSQSGDVGSPRRIQMQTRNPARTRVVVREFNITRSTFGVATFELAGLSAGADTADFFLDDVYVQSLPFVVTTPKLLLNTGSVQALDPDSLFVWTLPAYLADSFNVARLAADTVRGTLRSSDPSVVLVTDSLLSIRPNFATSTNDLQIVGVNPGTAILTLSAPGYPNFVDTVTVRPRAIALGGPSGVGQGLLSYMTLVRNSVPGAALPLTITHQGPGRVDFVEPLTEFPASQDLLFEYITGTTVGVDTVIVSAPGHVPDTTIYTVYASRAELVADAFVAGGFTHEFVYASLRFSESSAGYDPAATKRFRVTSSDTTRAKVLQDTIIVAAPGGSSRYAKVRYGNPGIVRLIMTDLDGVYAPDTLEVTVEPRRLYGWTDWDENYMPIGVRQRSYQNNMYVELGYYVERDTWVRFTTSRPGLISIPDSVKIPAGEAWAYFNIAAGDTVGGVRVTASLPGFTPWEFDVAVTRSILQICNCSAYVGADNVSEVYVVDALEQYGRPLAVATPLRFRSENSAIANVLQAEWTFPADSDYVAARVFRGVAPGRTTVSVTDARGDVFSRLEPAYSTIEIQQPILAARNTRYFATPGLETTGSDHIVDASMIRDSIWVRLTSANGRMLPAVDSVLVASPDIPLDGGIMSYTESSDTPFKLRGVSAGEDTLILNATGLPTQRVPVTVQPGVLRLAPNTPSVITVGDSLLVTVNFAGADGVIGATTSSNVTLNFGFLDAALRLAPSVVNAVNNALVVPPGATAASFWLKATSAGVGTFEINSESFRTLRITVEARARP